MRLNKLGVQQLDRGEFREALNHFEQALVIVREIGERQGEGAILNNIGNVYDNLGEYAKALDYFQQALVIAKQIGYKPGEAISLSNIAHLLKAQKQPKLAIVFYKQSVSTYEQIRKQLRSLPKQQQESYTKTIAHPYRFLADLLIQQDRILEIPLSALHDGEQWLVQNFRVNNITAKSLTDFTAKPQPKPKVLAGAFVEGNYNIPVIGKNYRFQGLTYAGKEVENLTKILPKTTKLIDKAFNKEDTTVKMNEYNIVHLATHAAFVPGDASLSFILFGNGEIANLREIGDWTLNNVDLVVLSACETGIGGKFGNGEEILGLGYQFQSRGARATIASLWQVDDGGTQVLMNGFYNALKQGKITKTEALRQAQIALITDDYSAVGGKRGGLLVEGDAEKPKQVSNNLEHPYYWAPFILIGNGL